MLLHCEEGMAGASAGSLSAPGWLRAETLDTVTDLNEMSLALLAEQAAVRSPQPGGLRPVADVWQRLDATARRRAAACPYLLLDAGFANPRPWQALGGGQPKGQIAEAREMAYTGFFSVPGALDVARLILTYAWHLARTEPAAARLLLGMPAPCANTLAHCTLRQMYELAGRQLEWLKPRWSGRPAVWLELLQAAAAGEGEALERARLHGLTLLAAEVRQAPAERSVRF
jgi:hypothetical protein